MVTDRYLAVHHHDDVPALADFARDHGLAVVAVDNPRARNGWRPPSYPASASCSSARKAPA